MQFLTVSHGRETPGSAVHRLAVTSSRPVGEHLSCLRSPPSRDLESPQDHSIQGGGPLPLLSSALHKCGSQHCFKYFVYLFIVLSVSSTRSLALGGRGSVYSSVVFSASDNVSKTWLVLVKYLLKECRRSIGGQQGDHTAFFCVDGEMLTVQFRRTGWKELCVGVT